METKQTEKLKFGEKILVWDRFEDRADEAYFVANVGGLYPYLVVYKIDEIDSLKNGYHKGADTIVSYKNAAKIDSMQKYEDAVKRSLFDNHELIDVFFNLIEARNAVWEVDDWKPDWCNLSEEKYNIRVINNRTDAVDGYYIAHVFAFKKPEIRNWFLNKFKKELKYLIVNNLM